MEKQKLGGNDRCTMADLSGNGESEDSINVAGDFSQVYRSTNASRKEGKRRGRRKVIEDAVLSSVRNSLVALLEGAWGEIGWNLQNIKTPADVRPAFSAWEGSLSLPYVLNALLRASEQPATAKKLRAMQLQSEKVNQSLADAQEARQLCLQALEKANRVSISQMSHDQQALVIEEQSKRKVKLEHMEEKYLSVQQTRKELDESIKNAHAYVARSEFVRFCRQGRYSLNPLNVANAMAGLPWIGYRQSVRRCRKWKLDGKSGGGYQILLVIRRIVDSRKRGVKLSIHAEQWLRSKHKPASDAIRELQYNWYYFRRSIGPIVNSKPHPTAVPYKLTTEYFRRLSKRNSVDAIFEDDERIVP